MKTICDIDLLICIEKELFMNQRYVFDSIFSTFTINGTYVNKAIKMYIFSNKKNENILDVDCKFFYDTNSKHSYFFLANFVEEFLTCVLCCTTIHGSMVRVFEKNILIIGTRKSGKTTLTKFLIEKYNAEYLNDDHVYIHTGVYKGFNMPMFLRTSEICRSQHMTFDEENVCRVAFIPRKKFEMVEGVDLIIFPHYCGQSKTEKRQLSGTRLFKMIMNNIRFYRDSPTLMKDIVRLSNNVMAYEVRYHCFDWLDDLLKR